MYRIFCKRATGSTPKINVNAARSLTRYFRYRLSFHCPRMCFCPQFWSLNRRQQLHQLFCHCNLTSSLRSTHLFPSYQQPLYRVSLFNTYHLRRRSHPLRHPRQFRLRRLTNYRYQSCNLQPNLYPLLPRKLTRCLVPTSLPEPNGSDGRLSSHFLCDHSHISPNSNLNLSDLDHPCHLHLPTLIMLTLSR